MKFYAIYAYIVDLFLSNYSRQFINYPCDILTGIFFFTELQNICTLIKGEKR